MPLEFLKRRGGGEAQPAAPPPSTLSAALPEEVIAQEFQLKLYYAGKSSEGVRMKAGPNAMNELPSMLVGLGKSEIEVVEPLPIEFSQATPTIARPSEAMQWLNAHHVHSPITRHALVVLESIDAIDLAFDTFVCSMLDGETDTSGYPEYNAVVGGVAARRRRGGRRRIAGLVGGRLGPVVVGLGGLGARGRPPVHLCPPGSLEQDGRRGEGLPNRPAAAVRTGFRARAVDAVDDLEAMAARGTGVVVGRHAGVGQPRSRRMPHLGQ